MYIHIYIYMYTYYMLKFPKPFKNLRLPQRPFHAQGQRCFVVTRVWARMPIHFHDSVWFLRFYGNVFVPGFSLGLLCIL